MVSTSYYKKFGKLEVFPGGFPDTIKVNNITRRKGTPKVGAISKAQKAQI